MQHHTSAGALEVDHFDPRLKKEYFQDYANLFPASRHCNNRKSDRWPNKEEKAVGCRFLNPCKEFDYGTQIFEDKSSHELVGTTPAARWHIRICALNADHLIEERKKRTKHLKNLRGAPIAFTGSLSRAQEFTSGYRELVENLIPEIPPPPKDS